MKLLIHTILILLICGCLSFVPTYEHPKWIETGFLDTENRQFIFVNDLELHQDLLELAIFEVVETYTDDSGYTYKLYQFNKTDIKELLDLDLLNAVDKVNNTIQEGKDLKELTKRYHSYKDAKDHISEIEPIMYIYEKYGIEREISMEKYNKEVSRLLENLIDRLSFKVIISSSSPSSLTPLVERFISEQGYTSSKDGNIEFYADLKVEDITLDNGYLNKMWYLNLTLIKSNGDVVFTDSYRGRESHIKESSLDELVVLEVYKKLLTNKDLILSNL